MLKHPIPFFIRSLFYVVGLLFLTLGVSFILKCGLGASAWDALAVGESNLSGWKIGYWIWINCGILLFINAWLLKQRPQYGAIFTFIIVGMFVNVWMYTILTKVTPGDLWQQWTLLLVGMLSLGIGISLYLQVGFPTNPIDSFMVAIHRRFSVSLGVAKLLGELVALILAFLLHGPIGIGTIVVTICIGPIVQLLFPYAERVVSSFEVK